MIRPSALTLARHCDLSASLSARFPERNANTDRGTAVDAQACKALDDGTIPIDRDAAAIVTWVRSNLTESGVEIVTQGTANLFDTDTGGLVTTGTYDLAAFTREDVRIVDFKKREQYAAGRLSDPDENDQLHAYALAVVDDVGAKSYRTCLLLFGDGQVEPIWSRLYTEKEWTPVRERISSLNESQPDDPKGQAGPHCAQCYPRHHCPHWALPAHTGPSALEPLTKPGGLNEENEGQALLAVMAIEEMADRAREALKAYAQTKPDRAIRVGNRRWGPVRMPGRTSVDVKALEDAGLYERFSKVGQPYEQWRMGKAK